MVLFVFLFYLFFAEIDGEETYVLIALVLDSLSESAHGHGERNSVKPPWVIQTDTPLWQQISNRSLKPMPERSGLVFGSVSAAHCLPHVLLCLPLYSYSHNISDNIISYHIFISLLGSLQIVSRS